jgi:hypothetical protein
MDGFEENMTIVFLDFECLCAKLRCLLIESMRQEIDLETVHSMFRKQISWSQSYDFGIYDCNASDVV